MSLDTLIATLTAEGDAQAEGEMARGRTEAQAITAAADERIGQRRGSAHAARDTDRRAAVERGLLDPRRQALREVLEARRDLVERVFTAARARFAEAVRSPSYLATLPGLVAAALACIGDRPAALRCPPDLVPAITRIAGGGPVTVVGDQSVGPGFRAVVEGGAMEVDATLEGRLAALAPALSLGILERLDRQA